MHLALIEAQKLNFDCVQVFTKNQRQWKVKPFTEEQIAQWHEHRKSTGVELAVSHASYLINLASPDDVAWEKSLELFRDELLRCEVLEIPWLVIHPGAHMGSGIEAGIARVASALNKLHEEKNLAKLKVVTCLEITAGQGSTIGHSLEQLRSMIDLVKQPQRVAFCLDTAHLLAAGYDLTSAEGAKNLLKEIQKTITLQRVAVLHVNDSKTPRGSHVDRHEHIGKGHVSTDALAVILQQSSLRKIPKILETPKEGSAPDGRAWDTVNLEKLVALSSV